MVVGPYMSNFELFYYLITSSHYLATVYCSLPPTPYAAYVRPLRAHPLAAVCVTAPGGWALGQGRKAHEAKQINHSTSMRAPTGQCANGPCSTAPRAPGLTGYRVARNWTGARQSRTEVF